MIKQNRSPHPTKDEYLGLAADSDNMSDLARKTGKGTEAVRRYINKQGWREEIEAAFLHGTTESRISPHVDEAEIRHQRTLAENRDLRSERAELYKRLVSQDELMDKIVEATRLPVDTPSYKPHVHAKRRHVNSVITPVYDQQFGQFVRAGDTPGNRGEYSVEVFDKRLARWVEGVCGIIAKRYQGYALDELVIPMGGDHVEGDDIFPGQSWQLELDPPRQVWVLAAKMSDAIKEVVRYAKEEIGIERLYIYGVDDNHGAVGGKKAGARPKTYSWNWLFLKLLFDQLREEPFDEMAIEPGGSLFFYCASHEFQMIHGQQIKGWGGLPFYGLAKYDGRSIRLHNRLFRYLLMGHHHQPASIPNGAGETIVSGDWVGSNNLSNMMTAASRPQQNVLFVSEKRGLDCIERVYFQDAHEAYTPTRIYGQGAENQV